MASLLIVTTTLRTVGATVILLLAIGFTAFDVITRTQRLIRLPGSSLLILPTPDLQLKGGADDRPVLLVGQARVEFVERSDRLRTTASKRAIESSGYNLPSLTLWGGDQWKVRSDLAVDLSDASCVGSSDAIPFGVRSTKDPECRAAIAALSSTIGWGALLRSFIPLGIVDTLLLAFFVISVRSQWRTLEIGGASLLEIDGGCSPSEREGTTASSASAHTHAGDLLFYRESR